jgi:bile acid:Na+ symporter, BASS family
MLPSLLNTSVLVFSVASMLSVGLGYTVREIARPFRDASAVARALVANFVVVPILAYAVAQLLGLGAPLAAGLMLLGMSAGAPFLIKLTEAADHDVGMAASLLILLLPITVIYLPIMVPLVAPAVSVSATAIAMPLLLSMLLPLGLGLLARAWLPEEAQRLRPLMGALGTIALVALVVLTFVVNFQEIAGLFGSGAILASAILVAGAFAIGYLLGGPDPGDRGVLGLGTAQRNIAAATVVATQSIGNPDTLALVVAGSMVAMAILFPTAWRLQRKRAEAHAWDLYDANLTGRG